MRNTKQSLRLPIVCGSMLLAVALAPACSDDGPANADGGGPIDGGPADSAADTRRPDSSPNDGAGPDAPAGPIGVDDGIAGNPIDRVGRPAISAVLLFSSDGSTDSLKDEHNHKSPHELTSGSAADQMNAMIDTLTALGSTPLQINGIDLIAVQLKGVLVGGGDVLKVDVSGTTNDYLGVELGVTGAFGGRDLTTDVVDISLAALTFQAITTDKVDANDRAFLATFPYLADPH